MHSLILSLWFLSRRNLETFQIPFESDDLAVLICNSNVRHELSNSEYPLRRAQCAEALRLMGLDSYKGATLANLEGKLTRFHIDFEMFITIELLFERHVNAYGFLFRL